MACGGLGCKIFVKSLARPFGPRTVDRGPGTGSCCCCAGTLIALYADRLAHRQRHCDRQFAVPTRQAKPLKTLMCCTCVTAEVGLILGNNFGRKMHAALIKIKMSLHY